LSKLTTSYHDAADALDGYWPRLGDAQALAVQALAKAKSAQGAVAAAQGQVESASAGADSAAAAYNSAALAAAFTPAPTPEAAAAAQSNVAGLQAGYQGAQAQVAAAQANLAAANADMAAAQHMKDTAVTDAHVASAAVAGALHAASAAGIQNPHHSWLSGVFDDIGDVASGAWDWSEHHVAGWAGDAGRDIAGAGEWAWHAVDNPDALKAAADAGGMALGLAAIAAGAGGEVGGGLLDATGVGALVGVPVNVASAALITAGAGMTAVSATDMGHNLTHMAQDANNASGRSGGSGDPKLSFDDKVDGQMGPRGWTQGEVEQTVRDPSATHPVWDYTSGTREPATAYERNNGSYVVVNDSTGQVVQVSDANNPNWKPVWDDPRFAR
jgi:hypothetical protein